MLTVEAVHIANQLCQYGYFFPVNDSKTLTVRDDSSLYRFQVPYLSLLRLTIESKFETGIYYHHHLYYTYIMYICICITLYKCYEKKYEKSFPIWSKTHSESDLYYYDIIRIVFSRIIYRCIESIFFFFFFKFFNARSIFRSKRFEAKYYKYYFYRFFNRKINLNIGKNLRDILSRFVARVNKPYIPKIGL